MKFRRLLLLPSFLLLACAAETASAPTDLGDFPAIGKADAIVQVDVDFEAPPSRDGEPGHGSVFVFRTCGSLSVTTSQNRSLSWERIQLVAESPIYRRRSWRGRAPHVAVPAERTAGECVEYQLEVLNWGSVTAYGTLHVATEPPAEAGVEVVFNRPDDGDGDPAGELRGRILDAIQSARHSLDLAMYGLEDEAVVEALCNAAEAGVNVRVVTDDASEDPEDSRSYYPFLFGPDGVAGCGAQVEAVRSNGLMHHKFMLVDAGTDDALLVMGSTNLTTAGLERNHNHMSFIRGASELVDAYEAEIDQLLRHCASQRLDSRSCRECTPSCVEDRSAEGPFMVGDVEARAYFSLSDDPLRVLRGEVRTVRMDAPDPACGVEDPDCICRISGSRYSCDYCAQGEDGYGLIGQASSRVAMSMYSSTDQCFALGLVRAAERGVEVTTVWDFVKSGSRYSRDDFVCSAGIATYITNWGHGSAQVRNHSKTVVIDDMVFDGSMNLSASAVRENNENTLLMRGAGVADTFSDYIDSEVALLQASGVTAQDADTCRCKDLVDNDGDGLFDGDDPDCDSGI